MACPHELMHKVVVCPHLADARRHELLHPEHVAVVAGDDAVGDRAGGGRVNVCRCHRGDRRADCRALGDSDEVVGGAEDRRVVVVVGDGHRERVSGRADGIDRARVRGDHLEHVLRRRLTVKRRFHLNNKNNKITSIAPKSLETKLRGASIQNG